MQLSAILVVDLLNSDLILIQMWSNHPNILSLTMLAKIG